MSSTHWGDAGPEGATWARLTLHEGIAIEGCAMRVEAYAVDENGDAAHPFVFHEVAALLEIYGYRLQEVEIRGRQYVICAFPHAD